jgi:hypothetical protein
MKLRTIKQWMQNSEKWRFIRLMQMGKNFSGNGFPVIYSFEVFATIMEQLGEIAKFNNLTIYAIPFKTRPLCRGNQGRTPFTICDFGFE